MRQVPFVAFLVCTWYNSGSVHFISRSTLWLIFRISVYTFSRLEISALSTVFLNPGRSGAVSPSALTPAFEQRPMPVSRTQPA